MSRELPEWAKHRIELLEYEIAMRQQEIDTIKNDPDLIPDHCCGLMGFDARRGDRCPACDWNSHRVTQRYATDEAFAKAKERVFKMHEELNRRLAKR